MRTWHPIALALLIAVPAAAAEDAAQMPAVAVQVEERADGQPTLDDLLWVARPVVVFADSPADPRFAQQLALLKERMPELVDRDVVVLTDADPAARGPLRETLRPSGFNLVLIDLDGSIAQRRPAPTSARELINLIDRMPSRRQETGSRRQ